MIYSLVIGSNGLLGRSVIQAISRTRKIVTYAHAFQWGNAEVLRNQFSAAIRTLMAESRNANWEVYWCAGASFVGANSTVLEEETKTFAIFLEEIQRICTHDDFRKGVFFLASSAGGLYAGSLGIISNEETIPRPISEYGKQKLLQEQLLAQFSVENQLSCLIGRISNLYGPNQRLDKPQGFITQLCRNAIAQKPVLIYVSLDTKRDYLFSSDAARLIFQEMDQLSSSPDSSRGSLKIKVFCSGTSTSLLQIISEFRRITKKPVRYSAAVDYRTSGQSFDIRLESLYPNQRNFELTSLVVGIKSVYSSVLSQMSSGGRVPP